MYLHLEAGDLGDWVPATWCVDRWYSFLKVGPAEERRGAVSRERGTSAEQATGQGSACMDVAAYQESLGGGSGDSGLLGEETQEHQCFVKLSGIWGHLRKLLLAPTVFTFLFSRTGFSTLLSP